MIVHARMPVRRRTAVPAPSLPEGLWVVTAHGDLDYETCPALLQVLETAARMHPVVILDATRVTFGDLGFLNMLLHVNRLTTLRIVSPPTQILRLIDLTGTDEVPHVYEDLATAVEACHPRRPPGESQVTNADVTSGRAVSS